MGAQYLGHAHHQHGVVHARGGPDADLLGTDQSHAYPKTRDRPDLQPNGTELIGRVFLEPDLGVCQITGIGPVIQHRMPTRAQVQRQRTSPHAEPTLTLGSHYTLMYTQTASGEEQYSSIAEILN